MKIARIESIPLRIPFTAGGSSGEGAWGGAGLQTAESSIVAVTTDTGVVGWGETFGFTAVPVAKAEIDTVLTPECVGRVFCKQFVKKSGTAPRHTGDEPWPLDLRDLQGLGPSPPRLGQPQSHLEKFSQNEPRSKTGPTGADPLPVADCSPEWKAPVRSVGRQNPSARFAASPVRTASRFVTTTAAGSGDRPSSSPRCQTTLFANHNTRRLKVDPECDLRPVQ